MDRDLPADQFEVRHTSVKHDLIICRRCRQVWRYPADSSLSPSATLTLLNHYKSHENEDEE